MYNMSGEEKVAIIAVCVLLVVYLLIIGLAFACYIMNAIALQKIASRRLISHPWLAWIPIASSWLMGSIVDEYDEKKGLKRKWRVVLLILSLIFLVGFIIGYVGIIVWVVMMTMQPELMEANLTSSIGFFVGFYVLFLVAAIIGSALGFCNAVCIYKIFESTVPEKSMKYFLLYLLVPMAGSICLLRCRNKGYSNEIIPETVLEETNVEEINVEETNIEE